MEPILSLSIDYDPADKKLLTELVIHREEILEQLKSNFGYLLQRPCFSNSLGEIRGFEIFIIDFYINEDEEYTINLKFDKQRYGIQIKMVINSRIPHYFWMYLERDFSIYNSRKFIEIVYTLLNNCKGKSFNIEDIRKYWDKLINEIPQSI